MFFIHSSFIYKHLRSSGCFIFLLIDNDSQVLGAPFDDGYPFLGLFLFIIFQNDILLGYIFSLIGNMQPYTVDSLIYSPWPLDNL